MTHPPQNPHARLPTKTRDGRAAIQDPRDHIGLVKSAARTLAAKTGTDPDEHIGAAYIAMDNATKTWDVSKGFQFSTHATTALKFRTYESFKRDCGYKFMRSGKAAGRFENLFTSVENLEAFLRLAHFDNGFGEGESAALLLSQILKAARNVSPCGEEAVMLLARGVHPVVASRAVGKTKKFCYYLIGEIEKRMVERGQLADDRAGGRRRLSRAPS